jgi:hypothetical protein
MFAVYCSVVLPCLSGCHLRLHSSVMLFTQCNYLVEYNTCLIIFMRSLHDTHKINI